MATKLSQGRSFAPAYRWTRGQYEAALLAVIPAPPTLEADRPQACLSPPVGVAGLLEAIAPRVAWQRDALCLEYPAVDFFADADQGAAKDVCGRCLVRVECRAAGEHEHGVWGATTSRERARLRRARVA